MQEISLFYHIVLQIFDLKILQSHYPRVFWPISQEPELSQMWDLCRFITDQIFQ